MPRRSFSAGGSAAAVVRQHNHGEWSRRDARDIDGSSREADMSGNELVKPRPSPARSVPRGDLAPATLAALPSARAVPNRDVFYLGNPVPRLLDS